MRSRYSVRRIRSVAFVPKATWESREIEIRSTNAQGGGGPRYQDSDGGVYIISVAARLLEMHPQTLRKYERLGLVRPSRTHGMLRLYSEDDLARLRMIKFLVEQRGMNLAGVELALHLVTRLMGVQRLMSSLMEEREETWAPIQQQVEDILAMLHFPGFKDSIQSSRPLGGGRDLEIQLF